ncbi:ATP-binding protein [Rhizobium leguminosarum]
MDSPSAATSNTRPSCAAYVKFIFDREMGVTLHNAKAGSARDDAMRELTKTTAGLYAKRVIRELIQNAFDGASRSGVARIVVRLDLTQGEHGTLYVANTGEGFTDKNVDAIANPAMSNKEPGNFIGHKGLGFRSVELLSDDVQIFSSNGPGRKTDYFDGFCFQFATQADETAWLLAEGEIEHAGTVVGRTHRLQLPVPIESNPQDVDKYAQDGFATLVRLPLRDALAKTRALEELRVLLEEETPLPLFLDRLDSLTLEKLTAEGPVSKVLTRQARNRRTLPRGRGLILEDVVVDRRRYLFASMPVDDAAFRASVDEAVAARHPVEKWRDWEGAPAVSVAIPLTADARKGTYYAFLPMDTTSPFNGSLDAPFFPEPDRRDLDLDNPLNSFLLDSVADLCLAVAEEIADANETDPELASAAVDAVAWHEDPDRFFRACQRAKLEVGAIRFPSMRRKSGESRWARLDVVFDWNDQGKRLINALRLVRVCDVPMLKRSLGVKRLEALKTFVDATEWVLEPADSNWASWGPALAADLKLRRKKSLEDWEGFYSDLAAMTSVLPHLRGTSIFLTETGALAAANSPEMLEKRELFINATPGQAGRRRRKVAGTVSLPPSSVTKNMEFADPALAWQPHVTKAFFDVGLATEFSLPRIIERIGRLGRRRTKQVSLAVLRWTFKAWLTNKTPEVQRAIRQAALRVPVASGEIHPASETRFGAGWRYTQGDLLAEFSTAASGVSRGAQALVSKLLPPWAEWPLAEIGTATEWVEFLKLINVRDGLWPVTYKSPTLSVGTWRGLIAGHTSALQVEVSTGAIWREGVQRAPVRGRFGYQSGEYTADLTLTTLPCQADYEKFSDVAKLAYARLIMNLLPELKDGFLTTILRRTAGLTDTVQWPSPLLAFLREASWIPVASRDIIKWARPRDCWYGLRAEPMPRFVARIERSVRDTLDATASARDFFSKRLGLALWADENTAVPRLLLLGAILGEGTLSEIDHDSFRKAHRDAWSDWNKVNPHTTIGTSITLAVQSGGQLAPMPLSKDVQGPVVFVGEGEDLAVEALLVSLGHPLLPAPQGAASAIVDALSTSLNGEFRLASATRPKILVDGAEFEPSSSERLLSDNREWLAELGVLVLEFNQGFSNRSTVRTKQQLLEAFGKLRVKFAAEILVEVEGKTGELPPELDGVLAVPHADQPTLIVQSHNTSLDWPTLARLARGIAPAVDRAWLQTDMRMVFQAIAAAQPQFVGQLDRPSDETIARALGQPVHRVREVLRSLRSTSRRLIEFLTPAVHVRWGATAARNLLNREDSLLDDSDVIKTLAADGVPAADATQLIELCREVDGLDELRRAMRAALADFNAALVALGAPWVPLSFERQIRERFAARVSERRIELEQQVRNAFLGDFDANKELTTYAEERKLAWLDIDEAWISDRDTIDDVTIDDRCDQTLVARFGSISVPHGLVGIEATRQYNRTRLIEAGEMLRKLVSAWYQKDPARGALPNVWRTSIEQIARDAMSTGALDFRTFDRPRLPVLLDAGRIWPNAMPKSVEFGALGLNESDLQTQAKLEADNREAAAKKRRTVTIGTTDIDGGVEGAFQAAAAALTEALSGDGFKDRSGPASLKKFPGAAKSGRRGRNRYSGTDPEYASDERRNLIGFAGEYAAYKYLGATVRNFSDEHWISSIGRRYLALPAKQDDDGFDFMVPRTRGNLYFEVKAHEGDPGYVELERSQVSSAVTMADERKGKWRILYVAYATTPERVTVYELPNPYSQSGIEFFRPSNKQGVRLMIEWNG